MAHITKCIDLRAQKGEDEVDELTTKARQLETELDLTTEKLGIVSLQLEEKEKSYGNLNWISIAIP